MNIDTDRINESRKERKRILFVGRDFERKNGPLTLAAFEILLQKKSDAELYIAGPSTLEVTNENIHFLGDISSEELADYYNLCDVFCMPSKFEAYGLVFIEALTYGLPCIGRNAFEMPYFIDDGVTGRLLGNENPNELAELMYELLTEEAYYDNVRRKREGYLKEYSWDTVADRIERIIESDARSV